MQTPHPPKNFKKGGNAQGLGGVKRVQAFFRAALECLLPVIWCEYEYEGCWMLQAAALL